MLADPGRILFGIVGLIVGVASTRLLSESRATLAPQPEIQVSPACDSPPLSVGVDSGPRRAACPVPLEAGESVAEGLPERETPPTEALELEEQPPPADARQTTTARLRQSIAEGIEVLRTAHPGDRAGRVMPAYVSGLAVVMDSGAFPCETMTSGDPRTIELERVRRREQLHLVIHKGRSYFFQRGVFPEYDAWSDGYWNGEFNRSKNPRDLPDTGGSMSAELEAALELRMLEAIALLGN